jgi:hypothetical protein
MILRNLLDFTGMLQDWGSDLFFCKCLFKEGEAVSTCTYGSAYE